RTVALPCRGVAGLERGCDPLVVLVASQVRVAETVDTLLATHYRLTGPRRDPAALPADQQLISASHTDRQTTFVVRTGAPIHDPSWTVGRLSLEDLVLEYMSHPAGTDRGMRPALEVLR